MSFVMNRENTLAIMVDMQEKLLAAMPDRAALAERTGILLKGLKILDIPVIVTQQYTKGLGNTDPALMEILGDEHFYDKLSYSCCRDSGIRNAIASYEDRKTVLLFGIESHICIWQTAQDLLHAGFSVQVVSDCVSSRKTFEKEMALRRLERAGAYLTSTESCLFEMLEEAGTAEFKAVSKLIK